MSFSKIAADIRRKQIAQEVVGVILRKKAEMEDPQRGSALSLSPGTGIQPMPHQPIRNWKTWNRTGIPRESFSPKEQVVPKSVAPSSGVTDRVAAQESVPPANGNAALSLPPGTGLQPMPYQPSLKQSLKGKEGAAPDTGFWNRYISAIRKMPDVVGTNITTAGRNLRRVSPLGVLFR